MIIGYLVNWLPGIDATTGRPRVPMLFVLHTRYPVEQGSKEKAGFLVSINAMLMFYLSTAVELVLGFSVLAPESY